MKITRKEQPVLFKYISEFIIEDSKHDHRRGSTFFVQSIVEFEEGDFAEIEVPDFSTKYVGTWETNVYVRSEEDTDWDEITELTKVNKVTKLVAKTETTWEPVG
jgi:hypothetical protein